MFIKGTTGIAPHPKLHTYEEGYFLPVLTSDELLFGNRHKGLLRLFRDLSEMPPEEFDSSYGAVLQNFMEFVQVIPSKQNDIMGGLLNYSLARTSAVYQKYVQLRKDTTNPLLKFAVFSASLLHDIGRVITNQRIVLFNDNNEYLQDWNPFSGSMVGQAKFYKLYPIAASYLPIEKQVTPMLARQLIPEALFQWLSSDPVLFADWLAALLGEEGVGSKEITFAVALVKREDIVAIVNTLDTPAVDMVAPPETDFADKFYRWLKAGIAKGEIPVNTDNAYVHVVPEGVLLEKQIFKQFSDLFSLPVTLLEVYYQVAVLMGIMRKGGTHFLNAAYFSPQEMGGNYTTFSGNIAQKTRQTHEGMVVDPQNIFINTTINTTSALKSTNKMTPLQYQSPMKIAELMAQAVLKK